MAKRRKISEIFDEVEKINNWKPSDKDLEELAEVLNEPSEDSKDEVSIEKIAIANIKENSVNGIEQSRI